jgi:hypothetical protein
VKRAIVFILMLTAGGCVVHDKTGEPEPWYWPTFIMKDSTVDPAKSPAPAISQDTNATGGGGAMVRSAPASNVGKTIWFDPDQFYISVPVNQSEPFGTPAAPPQPSSAAPATLYPTRGQAALQSQSPTLYPPSGSFQNDPGKGATVIPRGPEGPRGFRGQ